MSIPSVAIVGRPNVGKSSLLNRLAGRRVSIVEPTAGVTRDRVTHEIELEGRRVQLVDTGGLGLVDEALLKQHIESQIAVAIEMADLILFVVDAKTGPVPGDQLVATRLRRSGKAAMLVVNKVESRTEEFGVHAWVRLGFGEPLPISAKEGFGTSDLLAAIAARLPPGADEPAGPEPLKFAVVGKRNSGKSTLVNRLVGEERVIVSELPGTTRDAIDVLFEYGGERMLAIDTAGVRKKSSIQDAIELFSYTRATESIRRADCAVLLFDVAEEISQVDKKVAHYCVQNHKAVVLAGNKIDIAGNIDLTKWDAYIRQQLAGLQFAPAAFLSALEGDGVAAMLDLLFALREQASKPIATGPLNAVLHDAGIRLSPKGRGKKPKLFYATQIRTMPLTFLVFVNEAPLFRGLYERYLSNVLREAFDVPEVPIRFVFRERGRGKRIKGAPSFADVGETDAADQELRE